MLSSGMSFIETARLRLLQATSESAGAAASGDSELLGRLLNAEVPEDWPPRIGDDGGAMAREGLAYVRDLLKADPALAGWWGWFVILKERPSLIGSVSPKGPPNAAGDVEIAYAVVASQERKGYATEASLALMRWTAQDSRTKRIVAETLPELAGSIAVMKKCGLAFLGEGSETGAIRYGADVDDLRRRGVLS